jgi:hypothetical protein
MKAILREEENVYHSQMHNVPKILNSSISRTSRNEPKRLYTNTRFSPPLDHEGDFLFRIQDQKMQKPCNFTTSNEMMPPI